MPGTTLRQSTVSMVDRVGILALFLIVAMAAAAGMAGPERLTTLLIVTIGALVMRRVRNGVWPRFWFY